ncbi:ribokinase [Thalassospira alkalitolerans]|uniref:Ribokinase n=1 Tax=Thalassospira alkalitolerans TaxID=1293890 RepID=A0A1Y2LF37_9PROT|nr:ribokinase [Thalassospira alkalitolerans]OSQ49186.1 ribokinase [Thalassospira alkalitolerans]|tara:strand:- start:196489 stop:197412 length:924 start_codon:yes stop_codon:yes gene_type:complete
MTIAIVGSSNIDFSARVAELPKPGQTVAATGYTTGPGGKGCNQAIAVARLGQKPVFISKIGNDLLGRSLMDTLKAEGFDTSQLIQAPDAQTGTALISIDHTGENMITVAGGANMTMTRADIRDKQMLLENCTYLLVQLECPVVAVAYAMKYAHDVGATIILDPAPVPDRVVLRDLMALTDIVTPNSSECFAMTGIQPDSLETANQAAAKLREMGARIAVIKMGSKGAFYCDGDQSGIIEPFDVSAIDTVAAGDCFNAGLAVALHDGQALPDAVRFACATGALATTRHGAADAAPTLDQVMSLIEAAH